MRDPKNAKEDGTKGCGLLKIMQMIEQIMSERRLYTYICISVHLCVFAADLWAAFPPCPWQQMPSIEKLVNKKQKRQKNKTETHQKWFEENILEKHFPSLASALIYLWMKLCMKMVSAGGVVLFFLFFQV